MKKVTMKDVANVAGVSVATVSYVLNNNENETIPEETRKKVLEAVKKLNYVPNLAARSLVKKKSNLIGILIVKDYENNLPWRRAYYSEFIDRLVGNFNKLGYHVLISNIDKNNPEFEVILSRELEGVFLIDVNKEIFYDISNIFDVPIIIIDSFICDDYFQKIIPDLEGAVEKALKEINSPNTILLLDKFNDDEMNQRLLRAFEGRFNKIHIAEDYNKLIVYLEENKTNNYIVIGEFLGVVVSKFICSSNLAVICTCDSQYLLEDKIKKVVISNKLKAEKSTRIMMDYINGIYYNEKLLFIEAE